MIRKQNEKTLSSHRTKNKSNKNRKKKQPVNHFSWCWRTVAVTCVVRIPPSAPSSVCQIAIEQQVAARPSAISPSNAPPPAGTSREREREGTRELKQIPIQSEGFIECSNANHLLAVERRERTVNVTDYYYCFPEIVFAARYASTRPD